MFLPSHTWVYLAAGSTDMRKQIKGLPIIMADHLKIDPLSGHLFVFCKRRRTMIKVFIMGPERPPEDGCETG